MGLKMVERPVMTTVYTSGREMLLPIAWTGPVAYQSPPGDLGTQGGDREMGLSHHVGPNPSGAVGDLNRVPSKS